jgi:hypothetical protein
LRCSTTLITRRNLISKHRSSPPTGFGVCDALEAAARVFGHQADPGISLEEAKRALDAGYDDPLVLYLYPHFSSKPNDPGPEELERRYTAAAAAMQRSDYPPFRRAVALYQAGLQKAARKNLSSEDRAEAARLLDS